MREDAVCYKHENRSAAVACQRCERPICASCMEQASVGFHCPECAKTGAQKVHRGIGSTTGDAVLTKVILGLIALTFVFQLAGPENSSNLLLFGPAVQDGEFWRIITSGFAHSRTLILHIAFNGYILWIFGRQLEPLLGRLKFGLVYLGGLLGGSLAVLLFDFNQATLGASGAVLGLAGAMAVIHQKNGFSLLSSPAGFIIVANLVSPFILPSFNISFWGHFGGVIGGALVAAVVGTAATNKPQSGKLIAGVAAVLALAGAAVYVGLTNPLQGII